MNALEYSGDTHIFLIYISVFPLIASGYATVLSSFAEFIEDFIHIVK